MQAIAEELLTLPVVASQNSDLAILSVITVGIKSNVTGWRG